MPSGVGEGVDSNCVRPGRDPYMQSVLVLVLPDRVKSHVSFREIRTADIGHSCRGLSQWWTFLSLALGVPLSSGSVNTG